MSEIDDRLEQLRTAWQEQPDRRSIIELQAKILKTAKETAQPFVAAYHHDRPWPPKPFIKQVEEALA